MHVAAIIDPKNSPADTKKCLQEIKDEGYDVAPYASLGNLLEVGNLLNKPQEPVPTPGPKRVAGQPLKGAGGPAKGGGKAAAPGGVVTKHKAGGKGKGSQK